MSERVDLISLSVSKPNSEWELGAVHQVRPEPRAVHAFIESEVSATQATAWLFWDPRHGEPKQDVVRDAARREDFVFHAGLTLSMGGNPGVLDYVAPNWMFNLDPDPEIEATSWRMSLRACLVPPNVFRQMGNIDPDFAGIDGASLEFGHRCITNGVLIRHLPSLVERDSTGPAPHVPTADQWRFVFNRYGELWTKWALSRAAVRGDISLAKAVHAWRRARHWKRRPDPQPFRFTRPAAETAESASVTIIIPTIDRYPYLRSLLAQLRTQTIQPEQIIVVDQTEEGRLERGLASEFADLPLQVIYQDEPGQCTARNTALGDATGENILFLDDDEDMEDDLIERHLATLDRFDADISCGTLEEIGAGELPPHFRYVRVSDVFPTSNSMIRKSCLRDSGLFDLAYDRGVRADGDLGTRLYLSGKLAVLNPEISVLHYRAPRGGLRKHKSRVVTYAASRSTIRRRHLPEVTEVYLLLRYFTKRQLHESLCQRLFGTMRVRGSIGRRMLKSLLGMVHLPISYFKIRAARRKAVAMLSTYPRVPQLGPGAGRRDAATLPSASLAEPRREIERVL